MSQPSGICRTSSIIDRCTKQKYKRIFQSKYDHFAYLWTRSWFRTLQKLTMSKMDRTVKFSDRPKGYFYYWFSVSPSLLLSDFLVFSCPHSLSICFKFSFICMPPPLLFSLSLSLSTFLSLSLSSSLSMFLSFFLSLCFSLSLSLFLFSVSIFSLYVSLSLSLSRSLSLSFPSSLFQTFCVEALRGDHQLRRVHHCQGCPGRHQRGSR